MNEQTKGLVKEMRQASADLANGWQDHGDLYRRGGIGHATKCASATLAQAADTITSLSAQVERLRAECRAWRAMVDGKGLEANPWRPDRHVHTLAIAVTTEAFDDAKSARAAVDQHRDLEVP